MTYGDVFTLVFQISFALAMAWGIGWYCGLPGEFIGAFAVVSFMFATALRSIEALRRVKRLEGKLP